VKEAKFQAMVIKLAHLYGWRVCHFRPAMTSKGWRTPVTADGAGFPDLVLARRGRIIFAELKNETGKVSIQQKTWIDELGPSTIQVLAAVWRPKDWEEIEAAIIRRQWPS
jgi:hypothetical protein